MPSLLTDVAGCLHRIANGTISRVKGALYVVIGNAKNLKESDCALMLSFAAGDGDGFDLLYQRHSEAVYRFFYFGTHGDVSLASELFQDVWMTVVRGRARYTNEINFTDWLYHSAWARLHDHLRLHPLERKGEATQKKSTQQKSSVVSLESYRKTEGQKTELSSAEPMTAEPQSPKPNVEELLVEQDEVADKAEASADTILVKCIENMSPEHKEVVLLRFCFSMSLQDISDFLDVGLQTVEICFREAVKIVRDELSKSGDSELANG